MINDQRTAERLWVRSLWITLLNLFFFLYFVSQYYHRELDTRVILCGIVCRCIVAVCVARKMNRMTTQRSNDICIYKYMYYINITKKCDREKKIFLEGEFRFRTIMNRRWWSKCVSSFINIYHQNCANRATLLYKKLSFFREKNKKIWLHLN